jgi:UDP-N-acetylglucosamine 4-epimerase
MARRVATFAYIANAIQANILAALAPDDVQGEVFNVAVGTRASLNQLFEVLRAALGAVGIRYDRAPLHGEFRKGDVRHSLADIGKAQRLLGYAPSHDLGQGLGEMVGRAAAAAFGR